MSDLNLRPNQAYPDGGFEYKDDPNVAGIIKDSFTQFGKAIKQGTMTNIMNIGYPIRIQLPYTYPQLVAMEYNFLPQFLQKAYEATNLVDRLQWVITAFVSGYHIPVIISDNKGAIQHIVGETYQARTSNGCELYCETIGRIPPTIMWNCYGPDNIWEVHCQGSLQLNMSGANAVVGKRLGRNKVLFKDGTQVLFQAADILVEGLLMNDRVVNFINKVKFLIKKENQEFVAELSWERGQQKKGWLSGMKSYLSSMWSFEDLPKDFFEITIFQIENKKQKEIKKGRGSWLEYIEFDGVKLWKMNDVAQFPFNIEPEILLPFDGRLRKDRIFLESEDYQNAQLAQDKLEEEARLFNKLRNTNK